MLAPDVGHFNRDFHTHDFTYLGREEKLGHNNYNCTDSLSFPNNPVEWKFLKFVSNKIC